MRGFAARGQVARTPTPTIAAAGSSPGRTKERPQSHKGEGLICMSAKWGLGVGGWG
jgi:hypothetical protein